jgi:hypothetical protein
MYCVISTFVIGIVDFKHFPRVAIDVAHNLARFYFDSNIIHPTGR